VGKYPRDDLKPFYPHLEDYMPKRKFKFGMKPKDADDLAATAERISGVEAGSGSVEVVETKDKDGRRLQTQRVTTAPLDLLKKRGLLTNREFAAGERYRRDHFQSKVDPGPSSADWGASGGSFGPRTPSAFQSQPIADARARYREVGKKASGAVKNILILALEQEHNLSYIGKVMFGIHNDRDARIAGFVGLKVALGALADIYGS
jgi:hypothetical protein